MRNKDKKKFTLIEILTKKATEYNKFSFFDFAVLFIISVLISFPLLIDPNILKMNDMAGNTANLVYIKKILLETGIFPQWNPYVNYGIPIIADPLSTIFNPIVFIIFMLFPLDISIKILYFLVIFFSGMFFLLLLKYLRIQKYISLITSFTYMCGGYLAARIFSGHLEKILAYPLIPIFLLSLLILLRKGKIRWPGITAIIFTLFILSGAIYEFFYAFIIFCTVVIFQIILVIKNKTRNETSILFSLFSAFFLFLLFSAIKTVPIIDISNYLDHIRRPFDGSQNLVSVVYNVFLPFEDFFKQIKLESYLKSPYFWWESYAFIGPIPLAGLLLLPIVIRNKLNHQIVLLILIFLVVIAYSMVNHPLNPFYWIINYNTFLQQFRIPSRIFIFLAPITLVLAAISLNEIYAKVKVKIKVCLILLLIVNFLFVLSAFYGKIGKNEFVYSPPVQDLSDLLNFLKETDSNYFYIGQSPLFFNRVPVYPAIHNEQMIKHNYGFIIDKKKFMGLDRSTGIYPKYFILPRGEMPPEGFVYKKIYEGHAGSVVYENELFTPYADIYTAEVEKLNRAETVSPNIQDISIEANKIEVIANTNNKNDTLLVLTSYNPGWQASANNSSLELLENDYLNVNMKEGKTKYIFSYNSKTFIIGLFISTISLILWLAFVLKRKIY